MIVGNSAANESIIGGGGADSLVAGSGNDYIQGHINQVVYVHFNDVPGFHVYTPTEIQAILAGLEQDHQAFNYFFTLHLSHPQDVAQMTGGGYATLQINQALAGGASHPVYPGQPLPRGAS